MNLKTTFRLVLLFAGVPTLLAGCEVGIIAGIDKEREGPKVEKQPPPCGVRLRLGFLGVGLSGGFLRYRKIYSVADQHA